VVEGEDPSPDVTLFPSVAFHVILPLIIWTHV
jgi:hypothetical protein